MNFFRHIILLFLIFGSFQANGSKLTRAFDALEVYNYFEAKRLFEKSVKKHPVPAYYGLSIIYARRDNPFSNLDSAHAMINRSYSLYPDVKDKLKEKYDKKIQLDSFSIVKQRNHITQLYFDRSVEVHSIYGYQDFIDKNAWSPLVDSAEVLRDDLAFKKAKEGGKSIDYLNFANNYPQSQNNQRAVELYHETLYAEETASNNYIDYLNFVKRYPDSPYRYQAEDKLYELATKTGSEEAYRSFIIENPDNRNIADAWKHLFNAKMKRNYSSESIEAFAKDFPDYPFKSDLLIEKNMADKLLFPFKHQQKWGYMDKVGNLIIDEKFDQAEWFSEGIAVYRSNDKYGYINKLGKIIIPAQFDDALAFNEGYALVELDEKWGMIDRNGDLVIPIQYEELGVLKNGLSYFEQNDFYGYFDEKGKVRLHPQYDEAYDFENGFAIVSKNDFYGVIDAFGTTYLPFQFEDLFQIEEGVFLAQFKDLWGVITLEKDTLIPFEYDYISQASEGWMLIELDGQFNYADLNGKLLSKEWFDVYPEYRAFASMHQGYAKIKRKDGYNLIDTLGGFLFSKGVDDIGQMSDVIAVKKKELWGFKTVKGKDVIQAEYDYAQSFVNGVAIVKKDPFYGLIDKANNAIIQPYQEYLAFLTDSVLIVKRMGKVGLLNVKGDTLVNVQYQKIEPITNEVVSISSGSDVFYYNLETNTFIRRED